jgi:5-methylcytosine-specific restriction endonuclease McrA
MTNPFYLSEFWRDLKRQALQRDGYQCVVDGCDSRSHLTVDHINTRPNVPYPCAADTLGNLRTLCRLHDNSVKELPSGKRRNKGVLRVKGCDPAGRPLDPAHPWNQR